MKSLSLSKLLPQESEITINSKTYHLRPVNADDWAWMEAKWGNPSVKLKGMSIHELCMMLFRLIQEKEDFLPRKVTEYDDDGNPSEVTMPAYRLLAQSLQGFGGVEQATKAFEKALGVNELSDEDVRELEREAEKKIQMRMKKGPRTGRASLTK